jgi:uncharacterized protein involved in exopolysaccharide biosynthesis
MIILNLPKDYISVIRVNFSKIFLFSVFSGLIGLGVSYLIKPEYKSNIKILPPQQSQPSASMLLGPLGSVAGGGSSMLGLKNPNDLYIGILKSRSISDKIIDRFNLKERYNQKLISSARKILEQNSAIAAGKDGIISIDVWDHDPEVAAKIATAFVDELIVLTGELAISDASKRRSFLEKQVNLTKEKILTLERDISANVEKTGVTSVEIQTKSIIETTAKLRAVITAKEVQLKSMSPFVTQNNNEYKRLNQEIISLRTELDKLENGSRQSTTARPENELLSANIQKIRDLKYYQSLFELISKQYEAAKLDEAKDYPLIQTLDSAVVPDTKDKPKRIIFVFGFMILGLLSSILFQAKKLNILTFRKHNED